MTSKFEILIEDNFFSLYSQKEISQHIKSNIPRWEYWDEASLNDKASTLTKKWKENKSICESSAFISYIDKNIEFQNNLLGQINFAINKKFNIDVHHVLRAMFVYYPANPLYPQESIMIPHVDRTDVSIKNFLYYISENDAPTVFYNFKHTIESNKIDFNPSIYTTVDPKPGRAVLFDGSIYHSANVSRICPRVTLNMIFTSKSNKLTKEI